ncbi:hypothetical protein, unlikely [Trypanosoma brucei gambiense DAL972]|uniref:Uncharacterized protein n=1 Tax=Trypanosoma brucei gambiense (strain MHOM/CI/86/DAL972) TaxID=679716 RepID=C9ZV49_TRYB9|nr:hypothetical protein, unlikely [Trypanosoma brucei gambiense DAL972]CBH13287.1 hypothetical protein, unlikely [Trypanosoma brucei gambiense DAL972]|eukprot:XP_011775564.1 hypothetical protein, unlikely [Trypanosoma brucei gambiense DAL972]
MLVIRCSLLLCSPLLRRGTVVKVSAGVLLSLAVAVAVVTFAPLQALIPFCCCSFPVYLGVPYEYIRAVKNSFNSVDFFTAVRIYVHVYAPSRQRTEATQKEEHLRKETKRKEGSK